MFPGLIFLMILQSGTIISHPTLGENRESDADFQ